MNSMAALGIYYLWLWSRGHCKGKIGKLRSPWQCKFLHVSNYYGGKNTQKFARFLW